MDTRATTKVLVICQSQEASISLGRGEVLRLYCFSSGYSNGRKTN